MVATKDKWSENTWTKLDPKIEVENNNQASLVLGDYKYH